MPADFPSAPALNQTYTFNGRTWTYNGTGWQLVGNSTSSLTLTDGLIVPAASATAPSVRFTGNTNTGLYSPGANQVAIGTGGTERFRCDVNGNLLIGTSTATGTASQPLQVNGGAYFAGSVGIGTGSPGNILDVNDPGSGLRFQNAASGNFNIGLLGGTGSSDVYIYQRANGPLIFGTSNTERLRIDSSGQLTIAAKTNGLTNGVIFNVPYTGGQANGVSQCLQVAGTGNVNALARINMSTIDLAASNAAYISFATSPGGAGPASGDLTTERMRIDSSGTLLVNTTTDPTTGTFARPRIALKQSIDTGIGASIHLEANGDQSVISTGYDGTAWVYRTTFRGTGASKPINFIAGSGGVQLAVAATAWAAISDERQKTDLTPITNGLSKVAGLRSVIGRYITDDTDTRRSFLIAQDVQTVLPEAISVADDEDGTLSLRYTEVIPLLVAALKESKERIETLEAKVAALEAK